jgi:hypothetical protein
MNNAFDPLLELCFSKNPQEEIECIEKAMTEIEDLCLKKGVPFSRGQISWSLNSPSSINQVNVFRDGSDWLSWVSKVTPSFIAIVPKIAKTEDGTDGLSGCLTRAAKESGSYEKLRQLQEWAENKCIAFDIHAFFCSANVRTIYSWTSIFSIICSTKAEDDTGTDAEEDEPYDDQSYDFQSLSDEEVRNLALKLAQSDGFHIAKNQAERLNLAKRLFGDSIDNYDIVRIAKESAPIYKMELLPLRVKQLQSEGKDTKEIAEIVGESIKRVKQILSLNNSP